MLSMWFGANVLGAIRESLGPPRIPGSGLLLCGENKGRNGIDAAYPSLESLYSVQFIIIQLRIGAKNEILGHYQRILLKFLM